jgi:hypothetical protein
MAAPRNKKPAAKVPGRAPVKAARTIPIPGGVAHFYGQHELSPRRTRELQVLSARLAPRMAEIATAKEVTVGGKTVAKDDVFQGLPVGLEDAETRLFFHYNEVAVWAYLKSWNIDHPLPETPDDVLDFPPAVYEVVVAHAAKLILEAQSDTGGFTVDALPDDEDEEPDLTLPTGA